jgi:hypothetical protein
LGERISIRSSAATEPADESLDGQFGAVSFINWTLGLHQLGHDLVLLDELGFELSDAAFFSIIGPAIAGSASG